MLFQDRKDAGNQLAAKLQAYKDRKDTIVLGLARGGVVTASAIAESLHLPLNVIVVRKIGAPGNEELALGAIAETGEGVFNDHLITLLGVSKEYLKHEIEKQKALAKKRVALYHAGHPFIDLNEKIAIIVDDGIATGASMRAAIQSIHASGAKKIVLAVPVAAPDSLEKIEKEVDEVVCLSAPAFFEAVGGFYKVFDQTSDEEIVHLLSKFTKTI